MTEKVTFEAALNSLRGEVGAAKDQLRETLKAISGNRERGRITLRNSATNEERVIVADFAMIYSALGVLEQPLRELFNTELHFSEEEVAVQGKEWSALLQKEK